MMGKEAITETIEMSLCSNKLPFFNLPANC